MIPSKTTAAFHISADFKDETFKSNLQKHASCDSIKLNTYEKCPVKQTKSNIVLKTGEEHQLVSPFGKLCGHSGPFEAMILSKEDFTDDSFESTDESDINQDSNDPIGITHNHFHNIEVIWAKVKFILFLKKRIQVIYFFSFSQETMFALVSRNYYKSK
jgi:hypothetical protein